MSTPGGTSLASEAALRALARRARLHQRAGRLDRAAELIESARMEWRTVATGHEDLWRPTLAELAAQACSIAVDGGRLAGVVDGIDRELKALLGARTLDTDAARMAWARLNLEAGRSQLKQGDLAAARQRLEAALDAPGVHTLDGEPGALVRLRARLILGTVLCMRGDLGQGGQCLLAALAEAEGAGADVAARERALVLMNLGAANLEQQRLDEAQRWLVRAHAALLPLVRARRAGARADLGRNWVNRGNVRSGAGLLPQAAEAYQQALDEIDRALRSTRLPFDIARLHASRAHAQMNLGYCLFQAGDYRAAQGHLSRALKAHRPLIEGNPHLPADVARAAVNAGHLEARRGHLAPAAALYRQGLERFKAAQAATPSARVEADRAQAGLALARTELERNRAAASARWFEEAAATLSRLAQQGHLQQADAWLQGWLAQADLLVIRPHGAGAGAVAAALLAALRTPPARGFGERSDPLHTPRVALAAIRRWLDTATGTGAEDADGDDDGAVAHRLAAACLAHLLDLTAELLNTASPRALAGWQPMLTQWVDALGAAALEHPQAAMLLPAWFLHTRGLRAQRVALAASTDARLFEVRNRLLEMRRLEGQLLEPARSAEQGPPQPADMLDAGAHPPDGPGLSDRAERWRSLRDQVTGHIEKAVEAGLLPPSTRLTVQALCGHLAPGQALVMAARLDPSRLVLVALRGRTGGSADARHYVVDLPDWMVGLSCDQLLETARDAIRHDLRIDPKRRQALREPRPSDPRWMRGDAAADRLALAALGALADASLGPVLRELAGQGATCVGIVPADDLHALPWGHLMRRWAAPGLRLAVFPSAAAWSSTRLSSHLWPQGGNWPAVSGARATGAALPDCRYGQVLLSTCVYARSEGGLGEPLGPLSACFAMGTRFGSGWLVEIPDEAASLFSLAFQFALRQAFDQGQRVASLEVFNATCQAIEQGAWPAGFTTWLAESSRLEAPAIDPAPPPTLRRVLPWAVAWGV